MTAIMHSLVTTMSKRKYCSPTTPKESLSIVERHSNEASADTVVLHIRVYDKRYIVSTNLTSKWIPYRLIKADTLPLCLQSRVYNLLVQYMRLC
jgi:hypothetical protein